MTAPASAEKSRGPPLRARSARLRDAQNRGDKPTHRACRAKRPQRNRAIFETERALPNAANARRMPPTIDRPERADDRRRARRTVVWRGLGLDARRPPAAHDALLQPDRPWRSPRPPPPAHHPPRTDRGAHCRGAAFSETGTRLPPDSALAIASDEVAPAARETLGQRSTSRRAMQGYACRGAVSPIATAGSAAHGVARSRRAQIRRASEGRPARAAGIEGARLSARRRHRQGRGTRHEGSGASP